MESPVFKLEGIVKEKDDMSDFEGPDVDTSNAQQG